MSTDLTKPTTQWKTVDVHQQHDASRYHATVKENAPRIERMLDRLDASVKPEDMKVPGYKFHQLTGDRKGDYSVTVSGNWRITFKFDGENAVDVNYEDYH